MSLKKKLSGISMIILDVDGVLTDGKIIFDTDGRQYRNFDAHDGFGITRASSLGMRFAVISGKSSKATEYRMKRLGIKELYQDRMDKVAVYRKLRTKYRLKDDEVCYMGDDEFDLPLLNLVGVSAAPSDAVPRVRKEVDYVTKNSGGSGAVRELIDLILSAKRLL